jgi:hypothetical protein
MYRNPHVLEKVLADADRTWSILLLLENLNNKGRWKLQIISVKEAFPP